MLSIATSRYGISHNYKYGDSLLQGYGRSHITALMEYKDRLKAARKHAGITQAQLAERIGLNQTSISDLERGKSVSSSFSYQIASVCGVNPRWLVMGVGDMLSATGEAEDPAEYGAPSEDEYALIPQYDARASAGDGCLNEHVEIKGGLAFKRDWLRKLGLKPENLQVIYAEGDSMADTIMDGEVMLVDCVDREPRSGKIYAILRPDGGVSVKRLIQKSVTGTWTVASDNPDKRRYPDEDASAEVLHDIPIIGRMAWRGGGL